MAGYRKSGGSNVALTTKKRRSGGAFVDLTVAKRRSGGVWVDLGILGIVLSASPTSVFGDVTMTEPAPGSTGVTSSSTTVTASGGTGGSKTYSWARVSGSTSISANSPSSATSAFTGTVDKNSSITAVFRCTVSDGTYTNTVDVSVQLGYTAE